MLQTGSAHIMSCRAHKNFVDDCLLAEACEEANKDAKARLARVKAGHEARALFWEGVATYKVCEQHAHVIVMKRLAVSAVQ